MLQDDATDFRRSDKFTARESYEAKMGILAYSVPEEHHRLWQVLMYLGAKKTRTRAIEGYIVGTDVIKNWPKDVYNNLRDTVKVLDDVRVTITVGQHPKHQVPCHPKYAGSLRMYCLGLDITGIVDFPREPEFYKRIYERLYYDAEDIRNEWGWHYHDYDD